MLIGRKIYYDKATGNVYVTTSEMSGNVVETTQDQDFKTYSALSGIIPTTVDVVKLTYGQFAENFLIYPYHVDPVAKQIVWDTAPQPTLAATITDKLAQLDNLCKQSILAGITSSALSVAHQYDFDEEAQRNLSGRLSLINANANYPASFKWKTKDAGVLLHTKAQFTQLCTDADAFKDGQVAKYWTKKAQVNACTTQAQVATISWPKNTNPPVVPIGLAAPVPTTPVSGQVNLTWTANTDVTMIGGGGFNVYKDGVKANTALVTTASYTVTGLTAGTSYQFTITAVDTDGNESAKSTAITVKAS